MTAGHPRLDLRRQPAGLRGGERRARRDAGGRLPRARGELGQLLHQRLEAIAERIPGVVAEVRGQGLLAGIRLHRRSAEFIKALHDQGLVTVPARRRTCVRLLPPLTITADELAPGLRRWLRRPAGSWPA